MRMRSYLITAVFLLTSTLACDGAKIVVQEGDGEERAADSVETEESELESETSESVAEEESEAPPDPCDPCAPGVRQPPTCKQLEPCESDADCTGSYLTDSRCREGVCVYGVEGCTTDAGCRRWCERFYADYPGMEDYCDRLDFVCERPACPGQPRYCKQFTICSNIEDCPDDNFVFGYECREGRCLMHRRVCASETTCREWCEAEAPDTADLRCDPYRFECIQPACEQVANYCVNYQSCASGAECPADTPFWSFSCERDGCVHQTRVCASDAQCEDWCARYEAEVLGTEGYCASYRFRCR